MNQSQARFTSRKPMASSNPSPDTSINHSLTRTKDISFRVVRTPERKAHRIPLLKEISSLSEENQKLRSMLQTTDPTRLNRDHERKDREVESSKNQIVGSLSSSRKFMSLTGPMAHSEIERSREVVGRATEDAQELKELRTRNAELEKENEDFRRGIVSRSIKSSGVQKSNSDVSKLKIDAIDLESKMDKLQNIAGMKMNQLQSKIDHLERQLRQERMQRLSGPINRQKISLVSPKKESSTSKRESVRFSTPIKGEQQAISTLEQQITVSKNNVQDLQRQNEYLINELNSIKKANQELLKKSGDHNRARQKSFESQAQLNYLLSQNESLKDTLQGLRLNLEASDNESHALRLKLATIEGLHFQSKTELERQIAQHHSTPRRDDESLNLQVRLAEKERIIAELQMTNILIAKELNTTKAQLFSTQTHSNPQIISQLQQEHLQIQGENNYLRQRMQQLSSELEAARAQVQSSSVATYTETLVIKENGERLETIWNQLLQAKNQVDKLTLENRELEKQLALKPNNTSAGFSSLVKMKDDEITRLREELNRKLSEAQDSRISVGQNQDLRNQLNTLKAKLDQAGRTLEETEHLRLASHNQKELVTMNLDEVRRILDRINFEALENSLRQLTGQYRGIVEEKIQLLRVSEENSLGMVRLTSECERVRKEAADANMRFVNEKSQKERVLSLLNHEREEVRVLKEQVSGLSWVVQEYINRHTEMPGRVQIQESSIRQLDELMLDNEAERSLLQLQSLERQFHMVSARLNEIGQQVLPK